ncbi:MAG: FtsW/RodA/SpoVE family cell cycle protein, partial [Proteobacteria bacterium]|nr:FtsW/RodA/SpoVE family cell cycle protein [Pseudomonadota bacterium]
MKAETGRADYVIAVAALGLLGFGVIMVYSASHILAAERYGSGAHFFTRQVGFALAGLTAMFVLSRIDYHRLAALGPVIYGLAVAGLV